MRCAIMMADNGIDLVRAWIPVLHSIPNVAKPAERDLAQDDQARRQQHAERHAGDQPTRVPQRCWRMGALPCRYLFIFSSRWRRTGPLLLGCSARQGMGARGTRNTWCLRERCLWRNRSMAERTFWRDAFLLFGVALRKLSPRAEYKPRHGLMDRYLSYPLDEK